MALTSRVGEDLPTYITFYPALVITVLIAGFGPGLMATALTVLVVDYWVCTPGSLFMHWSAAEGTGVVLFLLMGGFLCGLIERYRRVREQSAAFEHALALREGEAKTRRTEEELEQTTMGYRLALKAGHLGTWNYNFEHVKYH